MAELSDRPLRVFLSYSSADRPTVRWLYHKLSAEGWIDPWIDELKLLPGQSWQPEIERAVEGSDAIIICLSNNSIQKEGFIQKELRYSLDIALQKPLYTSFLMPIRLDDCPIPRNLRDLVPVDFFPIEKRQTSYTRLLIALASRALELGILPANMPVDGFPDISSTPTYASEIARAFISYSRNDVEFVRNLAIDIQTFGLDVWWDVSGLRGGNNWVRAIQDALDKSKYCIVVITPDSMISQWVEREYTYAINNNIQVIPLLLRDCKLPFSFSTTQYIDFRDSRYRPALRELYAALMLID